MCCQGPARGSRAPAARARLPLASILHLVQERAGLLHWMSVPNRAGAHFARLLHPMHRSDVVTEPNRSRSASGAGS
jgi:hypothetical protein